MGKGRTFFCFLLLFYKLNITLHYGEKHQSKYVSLSCKEAAIIRLSARELVGGGRTRRILILFDVMTQSRWNGRLERPLCVFDLKI